MSDMPDTVVIPRLPLECPRPTLLTNILHSKGRHRAVALVCAKVRRHPFSERNSNGDEFSQRRYGFQLLRQVARATEQPFSQNSENLLLDFTGLGRSIIHVKGTLSGRSVGGIATDMLTERGHSGETQSDFQNCVTSHSGGVKVKSSSISLSRLDKIELVKRPDERRRFDVKRAAPSDAKRFCFSRVAFCNNLSEMHDWQGLTL